MFFISFVISRFSFSFVIFLLTHSSNDFISYCISFVMWLLFTPAISFAVFFSASMFIRSIFPSNSHMFLIISVHFFLFVQFILFCPFFLSIGLISNIVNVCIILSIFCISVLFLYSFFSIACTIFCIVLYFLSLSYFILCFFLSFSYAVSNMPM